jgi:DNA-binding transcriptional LysR family regulator
VGAGSLEEEVCAGSAVGFGTPAKYEAGPGKLRSLPFDPPLSFPTYVSWHAGRSRVVDAFAQYMSDLHEFRGELVAS